jgi:RNA polymerase sigma factor (sigma-70 family)
VRIKDEPMARTPWSEVLARCTAGEEAAGDDVLLRRFLDRQDQSAFELILWRHGGRVLRLCQGILHDAQEAEDAFQATFLVLARKAGSVLSHGSVGSWLHKVAYRIALRARQARSRIPQDDLLAAFATTSGSESQAEGRELRAVVEDELFKLPEKFRAVVALCYLGGLSTVQAAEQLGCPRGTILSRLATARRLLRKRLTRRGFAVSAGVLAMVATRSPVQASPTTVLINATCHAARLAAGGTTTVRGLAPHASARAVEFMEGTMNVMLLAKVKWLAALAVLVLLSAGVGAWMQKPAPGQPPTGLDIVTRAKAEPQSEKPRSTAVPDTITLTGEQITVTGRAELRQPPPLDPSQAPTVPANSVVITRPAGEWERVIDAGPVTGTLNMRFEATNKMYFTLRVKTDSTLTAMLAEEIGKMPALGNLEVGIKLCAEYNMASDGLLYGIFTGCEIEAESLKKLNLPGEQGLFLRAGLAAAEAAGGLFIDQPFSLRFRQDGNSLTMKDLKFLGLDLFANFMPGGPAAYQAIVTGRYKRKSISGAAMLSEMPPLVRQAGHSEEKPVTGATLEQAERDFRMAEHYQSQGQVAQAHFQYELIKRRYAGTRYATEAAARAVQLLDK